MTSLIRKLAFISFTTLVALAAHANVLPPPHVQSTRLLLPVMMESGEAGAFGALWKTELWVRNRATTAVYIFPYDSGCRLSNCGPIPPTLPGSTFQPRVGKWQGSGNIQGQFLHVENGYEDQVSVQLRVRNLRDEQNGFGTELPVISEDEFQSKAIVLLDLPVRPGYRTMLRTYSLDPVDVPAVIIRVYGLSEEWHFPLPTSPLPQLLSEQRHELEAPPSTIRRFVPDYLQIELDQAAFAPWDRVMLEIIPATEGMRIWSFASVTNNATQQITTITPQPGAAKGE